MILKTIVLMCAFSGFVPCGIPEHPVVQKFYETDILDDSLLACTETPNIPGDIPPKFEISDRDFRNEVLRETSFPPVRYSTEVSDAQRLAHNRRPAEKEPPPLVIVPTPGSLAILLALAGLSRLALHYIVQRDNLENPHAPD